jgi:hypothetical protein
MNTHARVLLLCSVILLSVVSFPLHGISQDKRWVYFSYDKNEEGTNYYYDRETIVYSGQNRVSVWMKIASPSGEELLQTEIECFGRMFRTIVGPQSFFGSRSKESYVAYGWLDIPPDSEIYLLSKIVCKPPARK